MDKINIINLGMAEQNEPTTLTIGAAEVQIKPVVAYEELFATIQWAVTFIVDDRPFVSGPLYRVIREMSLAKMYTNLDVAPMELIGFSAGELYEWFDILESHNVFEKIREVASAKQIAFFEETLDKTVNSLVQYRNSAAGILEKIKVDNQNSADAVAAITKMLDNPDEMSQIKKMFELMDLQNTNKPTPAEEPAKTVTPVQSLEEIGLAE